MAIELSDRDFRPRLVSPLAVLGLLAVIGCGAATNNQGLTKVSGIVHVGGSATEGVSFALHPQSGAEALATGTSAADGTFQISTYEYGDGVAPGEYAVTCEWGTFDPILRSTQGDRLGGKYASPKDPRLHWVIAHGEAMDVGTIELSR